LPWIIQEPMNERKILEKSEIYQTHLSSLTNQFEVHPKCITARQPIYSARSGDSAWRDHCDTNPSERMVRRTVDAASRMRGTRR
jgi:hypothetical protein